MESHLPPASATSVFRQAPEEKLVKTLLNRSKTPTHDSPINDAMALSMVSMLTSLVCFRLATLSELIHLCARTWPVGSFFPLNLGEAHHGVATFSIFDSRHRTWDHLNMGPHASLGCIFNTNDHGRLRLKPFGFPQLGPYAGFTVH